MGAILRSLILSAGLLFSPAYLMAQERPNFYYLENVEGTEETIWTYVCHSHSTIPTKSVVGNVPFAKNFSTLGLNCSQVIEIERPDLQQFVVDVTEELESRKDKVYSSELKEATGIVGFTFSLITGTLSLAGLYEMSNEAERMFSLKATRRFTVGSAFLTAMVFTASAAFLLDSFEKEERETYQTFQYLQEQVRQGVVWGNGDEGIDRQILQSFDDFLTKTGRVVNP